VTLHNQRRLSRRRFSEAFWQAERLPCNSLAAESANCRASAPLAEYRLQNGDAQLCLSLVSSDPVKLIDCPRDAWQGLEQQIPTELKVRYLRALIDAGFKHIDAVSFVSPKAVPQMADSEHVLEQFDPPP